MIAETAISVPTQVKHQLEAAGRNHRPIRLSIDTDVSFDGTTDRQWLVVTDDHLSVAREAGGRDDAIRSFAWDQIKSVRTVVGVGSGLVQAQVDDEWIDLLRFSNTLAQRFDKVARRLDDWAKNGGPVLAEESHEPLDPPQCPTCDLRLSTKHDSCPRCVPRRQVMQRAWALIAPYWRGSVVLCLLTVVGVAAELIPPKLQQYMVDHLLTAEAQASPENIRTALLVVVLGLALSRIVLSIVGVIKGRLACVIGAGLTCSLRKEMLAKLQHLAVSYYDRHQVGSMISRVAHDSEVLHGLMHQLTGGFLLQTVQLVGVGAMLVWLNPKLALFTLIPVPLVFLGTWIFWRAVYPRYYRLWDASSKQLSVLSGMLSGIRIVKAFAQEDREYRRFESAADRLRDWRQWVEYTSSRYSATMQLVFSLGGLIVWYVGGRDVIGDEMSLGELIAFLAYLAMFYAPMGALSNFTAWLTSFLSGSKRVFELLDTPIDIEEPAQPVPWSEPRGEVKFEHVTFGYDRHQPVLKDVSFDVKPGEMIGIVGRSGSGKSTMVNLLARLYDVQEGRVTIDGIDVRHLSTHELRAHLGVVFQDSYLLRGTIWNNLAYGQPDTTIEAGLEAAKAAGAHDFICRAQLGYETQLGEHGAGLSGGEKQRLSIARTLLYNPRILVLDEATSNIDAEAEKSIQEALENLIKGRTTIAIAHRLSTLRNADRILVFDRGRLVEQGTHAELLKADGVYARLVRIQTQVTKDPNVDRLIHRLESDEPASGDSLDLAPEGSIFDTADTNESTRQGAIQWLDPHEYLFATDSYGQARLCQRDEAGPGQAVYLVRAFPASHPEAYLSVRRWNENGDDEEVGMVRDLSEWSPESQEVVRASIERHYLLREIEGVNRVQLQGGFLQFDVNTDRGPQKFIMRWTQSQAVDFGPNGKLLIDAEDNRYVVSDVEALPKKDRERFLQYVYW